MKRNELEQSDMATYGFAFIALVVAVVIASSSTRMLMNLAQFHDADAIGDLVHDPKVVGDEQDRHAHAGLHVFQELENLRLHGDIERGCRLVGDQKIRLVGERHSDHHALALAAGKLMRIARKPMLRIGNADLREQFERADAGGSAGDAAVEQ